MHKNVAEVSLCLHDYSDSLIRCESSGFVGELASGADGAFLGSGLRGLNTHLCDMS